MDVAQQSLLWSTFLRGRQMLTECPIVLIFCVQKAFSTGILGPIKIEYTQLKQKYQYNYNTN